MFVLGLTGSIGMGKTTTAALFRKAGVPVHDSDADVHAAYQGEGAALVAAAFPDAVVDGAIDRARLAALVRDTPAALAELERIVHPLVRESRTGFVRAAAMAGEKLVVLDIPLLFETGAEGEVDAAVVVSAPEDVQKQRVLARPGMTPEWLEVILSRQMPDAEKRRRAQFVVDTSKGLDDAERQVQDILRAVAGAQERGPILKE